MTYCCKEMETLKNTDSDCDINIDGRGRLTSCDDDGDRLPPVRFCPYCGRDVREQFLLEVQGLRGEE